MAGAQDMAIRLAHLPIREARREFDRRYFRYQLGFEGGSRTALARRAGIQRAAVQRALKRLRLA